MAARTQPVAFCLVYVPEGIPGNNLALNFSNNPGVVTSMYVPEQHVIVSGVTNGDTPQRFYSYQSRSLASNDCVMMLYRCMGAEATDIVFRVSFMIAFG
jgi:hypothetical protein